MPSILSDLACVIVPPLMAGALGAGMVVLVGMTGTVRGSYPRAVKASSVPGTGIGSPPSACRTSRPMSSHPPAHRPEGPASHQRQGLQRVGSPARPRRPPLAVSRSRATPVRAPDGVLAAPRIGYDRSRDMNCPCNRLHGPGDPGSFFPAKVSARYLQPRSIRSPKVSVRYLRPDPDTPCPKVSA